jgi:molybdopterin-guanine dinucleotide biosynthesis protein MobB
VKPERVPLIVSFFGWSDSGKTTLIVELIEECGRRGLACAAAKCTRHGGDFEPEGKDSARYRAAGASPVAFIGTGDGGMTALFLPTPARRDRTWLESLFPDADLVLVEGLEVEGATRILVGREDQKPKRQVGSVDIVITEDVELRKECESAGTRVYARAETGNIIDFLEATWKGK